MRYRVYCDDALIADTYIPDPSMHLAESSLKLADCSAGAFEFVVGKGNPGWGTIKRMESTIYVVQDTSTILWSGRVTSESEDFWRRRKFVCEGALAYLNDSCTLIKRYLFENDTTNVKEMLIELISLHNSKVGEDPSRPSYRRRFLPTVICDVVDADNGDEYETKQETVWDWINDNLITRLGGHMSVIYPQWTGNVPITSIIPQLQYVSDYTASSDQTIEFGTNLLDFTKNWDLSNLATVILPRGKKIDPDTETQDNLEDDDADLDKYVTIQKAIINKDLPASNPAKYYSSWFTTAEKERGDDMYIIPTKFVENGVSGVSATAYETYGRIEKIIDFGDIESPTYLMTLGKIYLRNLQFKDVVIEMHAIDMHSVKSSVTKFKLLDKVRCISNPHGMDRYFPITSIDYDLENPGNTKYTLGESVTGSLTGQTAKSSKKMTSDVNFKVSAVLDIAKDQASQIMNNVQNTGYVNIVKESDVCEAIIISNTQDWRTASAKWVWNINGLGFTNHTYDSSGHYNWTNDAQQSWYTTAITMDGKIVANVIKAGILSDGKGSNFWNLETGEFSMNSGTYVRDNNGNPMGTVVDYINYAQNVGAEAEKINKKVKVIGGQQLLNGTGDWEKWRKRGNFNFSKSKGIATCNAPSTISASDTGTHYIKSPKKNVKYSQIRNKSCTLSFEAYSADTWGATKTTNRLFITFFLVDGSTEKIKAGYSRKVTTLNTTWSKKILTITFKDSLFTKHSGYENMKFADSNLYFDIRIANQSKHKIYIRQIKFELGTVATGYSTSAEDQQDFTLSQVYALDESFKQEKIIKRLTRNGQFDGIWSRNGKIYIKGTYIKSGTLDAGIIKAGIIKDTRGFTTWNMATGDFSIGQGKIFCGAEPQYFYIAKYTPLPGGAIEQHFTNTKRYSPTIQLHNGIITFGFRIPQTKQKTGKQYFAYSNKLDVSFASIQGFSSNIGAKENDWYGMRIQAKRGIFLDSESIHVKTYDNGSFYQEGETHQDVFLLNTEGSFDQLIFCKGLLVGYIHNSTTRNVTNMGQIGSVY